MASEQAAQQPSGFFAEINEVCQRHGVSIKVEVDSPPWEAGISEIVVLTKIGVQVWKRAFDDPRDTDETNAPW